MPDPRYPIGPLQLKSGPLSDAERKAFISNIRTLPDRLEAAVRGLTPKQLATPYREGGWMVRQIIHHYADSHMNAYVRCKLALTEDQPTVKPYDQSLWAELSDARSEDITVSLQLVRALHTRWTQMLDSLRPEDFVRRFNHPEEGTRDLDWILQLYGWHSLHHVAQINALKERLGW